MRLLKLHDLYVARTVLMSVLLTWAVLTGLDVVIAMTGEVRDIGRGSYTAAHAVAFVAYSVPRRIYTIFPTAATIGALLGLGQLAATSELTALRALGLSRRRLATTVAITLGLLTAAMVVNSETLAPWSQRLGDSMKLSAKYGNVAVARYSGLWAREGNVYLTAQGGEEHLGDGSEKNSWLELQDVRLYEVGEDGRLQAIVHAGTAEHHRGTGWVLKNGNRIELGEKSATRTRFVEQAWDSKLDAVALAGGISKPRTLSTHALGTTIDYRVRNGLDARDYQDLYWSRWFYPLGVLALCLAVVPFAFGTLRSGGMGKRLFFGILFSLGFLLLQTFASRMADAMRFDFRIAYALPPLLVLAVSMWMFRGREE